MHCCVYVDELDIITTAKAVVLIGAPLYELITVWLAVNADLRYNIT
mgnify:CR=1 FL=1